MTSLNSSTSQDMLIHTIAMTHHRQPYRCLGLQTSTAGHLCCLFVTSVKPYQPYTNQSLTFGISWPTQPDFLDFPST